ncbi:hypothetical protein VrSk94_06920 [Vibrio rotiferianus]
MHTFTLLNDQANILVINHFFLSSKFVYDYSSPNSTQRGWAMHTTNADNNNTIPENDDIDEQLQRLSEISFQALNELAEMIEKGKDYSDE